MIAISFCFFPGCFGSDTSPRVALDGKVTAPGHTNLNGKLSFTPIGGGPACGASVTAGEFEISKERGPVPGEYRVIFTLAGNKMDDGIEGDGSDEFQPMKFTIPEDGGNLLLKFSVNPTYGKEPDKQ